MRWARGDILRIFVSVIGMASFLLAFFLSFRPLFAQAHLPPGKPAGVKKAGVTDEKRELYLVGGIALVSASVAIVLISDKSSSATSSTTP
jgi:hypothetical protein